MNDDRRVDEHSKDKQLETFRRETGEELTTNQGVSIDDTDNSLKVGERGPTLLEDFHFREKMTHFDHERIPERVVHARGSGAHGYFQVYESMAEYTKAKFLQDPNAKTPVFVRFSTVVGFRGSADTVRDVRGFAAKFYTEEGVYDLVGNNMPVFFIQDAIKFPDLVHSIKPEPHNQIPQASAAHDNFWDFISLMPESMHMIMWVLSDRALPRSYRMMEGFGVHTFRFINEAGKARFVKFHWKPKLGMHSLVWDEVQKLAGKDPDYNRRDLWNAIEMGEYPEFELGVQIIEEEDEHKFDFDILDPTKIIPEEMVPVKIIGKMVLNRNPDNFFAETEQVAFHPGHVVPGIDFSNDPLLQGRLFSYLDTQLIRLGGPNFAEIPINRSACPVHNNQRDGYSRQTIDKGRTNYSPNSLGGGCPMANPENLRAFTHYAEKVEGHKIRKRSDSFKDHFSQATLFWNSMSSAEKDHIVSAAHFELGKVQYKEIRQRMVDLFNQIDNELAKRVAKGIGIPEPQPVAQNHGQSSPALSMENTVKDTVSSRQVAILAADGFDNSQVNAMQQALQNAGAKAMIVSQFSNTITSSTGEEMEVDKTFLTSASVMFDAIYVPGGSQSIETLKQQGDAIHFINEAFRHSKAIAATGEGEELLKASQIQGVHLNGSQGEVSSDSGVISVQNASNMHAVAQTFIEAIAQHRHWMRQQKSKVPA
ncbi:catalase [Desertifilum sp. FACHB-1129]|uniref:Catalase n=1 Tax=Desertifilum tharense IPPAS B-1220 TaxID=1781255 RepID=A0A1E5QDY3_9CYAN|nr:MULTISPECIES: catalase [Desertifilum]MDA0209091.1 catalase [Cyanobacteria bacterium FC1]MBD2310574.1 catalase [Desertifilum sp. FACHB-1129]MBD2322026.1 catalase [Desertifilum sp. FACHB-866]MBD2332153.1 catalase [Desertifilum sp. FACHB-868]OEJ72875.1 catalase HPII [Desertifilum tharense IPPAS B-1220]